MFKRSLESTDKREDDDTELDQSAILAFASAMAPLLEGKINARAECGGIQRTHFYAKIRCVSDPVKLKSISHAHT